MIRFGLFEDFKRATTLLIWGDGVGMDDLTALFRGMADGHLRTVRLEDLPWAVSTQGTRLQMSVVPPGPEGTVISRTRTGWGVEWRGRAEQFATAGDLAETLISEACRSGHQYLDTDTCQIMISKGEYPADFPNEAH